MKIGIAGYGFVGKAHELILKDYHEVIVSDPDQGHYGDLRHADAIIICVSTPARADGGCHMDNVFNVVDAAPDVPILIKSTISVEGWRTIKDAFPNRSLTFSPEFLRAEHWQKDALENKDWYMGGDACNFWSELFITALGKINVIVQKPEELIVAKQLRNSFLALKVSFFNQVHDFCIAEGVNPHAAIQAVVDDPRIGESHSYITTQRGFGGHCFPKDVKATIHSAQKAGSRITLLEEALNYNNTIRKNA